MRYELGDFVKIKKRWKKQEYPRIFDGGKDYFDYCEKHGHDEGIPIHTMKKIKHVEQGYVCGVRRGVKTFHRLDWQEEVDVGVGVIGEHIYANEQKYEDMYLVATRMNCIYRVSKEDITLLKDNTNH